MAGKRSLCQVCYADRGVRALYPRRGKWLDREPTDAELDALIAQQSRPENLPAWWRVSGAANV